MDYTFNVELRFSGTSKNHTGVVAVSVTAVDQKSAEGKLAGLLRTDYPSHTSYQVLSVLHREAGLAPSGDV